MVRKGERVERVEERATPVGNKGTLQPGARNFHQHRYATSAERLDIEATNVNECSETCLYTEISRFAQEEGLTLKANKEEALYVEEHTFDQDIYKSENVQFSHDA